MYLRLGMGLGFLVVVELGVEGGAPLLLGDRVRPGSLSSGTTHGSFTCNTHKPWSEFNTKCITRKVEKGQNEGSSSYSSNTSRLNSL